MVDVKYFALYFALTFDFDSFEYLFWQIQSLDKTVMTIDLLVT